MKVSFATIKTFPNIKTIAGLSAIAGMAAAGAWAASMQSINALIADLDLEALRSALAYPIIVDGRNLYEPSLISSHGFLYYSVGRPDAQPKHQIEKSATAAAAVARIAALCATGKSLVFCGE